MFYYVDACRHRAARSVSKLIFKPFLLTVLKHQIVKPNIWYGTFLKRKVGLPLLQFDMLGKDWGGQQDGRRLMSYRLCILFDNSVSTMSLNIMATFDLNQGELLRPRNWNQTWAISQAIHLIYEPLKSLISHTRESCGSEVTYPS